MKLIGGCKQGVGCPGWRSGLSSVNHVWWLTAALLVLLVAVESTTVDDEWMVDQTTGENSSDIAYEACTDSQHECLCGLPRCVDQSSVGDGVIDCLEGSDEVHIEKSGYICPADLDERRRQSMDSDDTSRDREKRAAQQDASGIMLVKEGDGTRIVYSSEANFEVVQPPRSDGSTPVIRLGTAQLEGGKLSGVLVESPKNEMEKDVDLNTGDFELLTITIGTPVDVAHSTKFPEKVMIMKMEDFMKSAGQQNEITDNAIPQARKVSMNNAEKEIIIPDRVGARNLNLPTFTVKVPDQTLEEVVHGAGGLRKKAPNAIPDYKITKKSKNVEDFRAEFNLESGDGRSDLPTVTYIGFADFTTTIADTVVVFTPRSKTVTKTSQQVLVVQTQEPEPVRVASPFDGFGPLSSLAPRKVPDGPTFAQTPPLESSISNPDLFIVKSEPTMTMPELPVSKLDKKEMSTVMVKKSDGSSMMQDEKEVLEPVTQTTSADSITFSTVDSKRYNTVDLYPSGLVSSIGGTIIGNGMTTVFTTYIYGTFIKNQYAQIVQSTSSIFYLVSRAPGSSISPTQTSTIVATEPPPAVEEVTKKDFLLFENNYDLEEVTTESITNNILEDFLDNSIGRAISSDPSEQTIVERQKDGSLPAEVTPSVTTLTHFTTYFRNGDLTVSTQYETSTVLPFFEISSQKSSEYNDESDFTTLTSFTTKFVSGSTQVVSNTEVVSMDMIQPTGVLKMEITKSPEDMMNFEMFGTNDVTTPRSSTESVTESFSESISETSTDLSSQDVTEQPLFNLDSSLNPEEDVDAIFYPRTYYITYTYFTTFHQENSSSVISSFETVTNIITNSLDLDEHRTISPITATPPVTYWTTYTYWTTFHKDNTTVTTSSEETVSNVVGATAGITPTKTTDLLIITPTSTFTKSADDEVMETVDVTTYYTTYTYYTSTFLGSSTIVNSRLETITNVVPSTQTETVSSEIPSILFGFDDTTEETTTTTEFSPFVEEVITEEISTVEEPVNDQPIGLLSTIRGSTVLDGTTTLFSTRVFGTLVNGLYFQMQSTTSQIITPVPSQTVGVLTVDAGKIIENGLTTHYTSQYVGIVADGVTTQEVRTTATIDGEPDFAAFLNKDSKTGVVRETQGSIVHGTVTTVYQSTVLGTYINGLYAQIIQSTSSSVIGQSAVFSTLPAATTPEIDVTPTLQASLNDVTISPTPVLTPSLRLPIEKEISSVDKKEKFRASPALSKTSSIKKSSIGSSSSRPGGRASSSRRPDIFGFIRRTSTFTFPSTLIGNLPGSDKSKISPAATSQVKVTPTEPIAKHEVKNTELFEQPTRRHRFHASQRNSRPSIHPRESIRRKQSISPSSVKPVQKTKEAEKKPVEEEEETSGGNSPVNSFRPFSFRRQEAAPGTRSALPFLPRNRRPGDASQEPKGNRPVNSRFAPTTKATTPKPEPTTAAPKKNNSPKRNRPQSASRLSAEERRKQRQRLASRPALSRLFPKRNQDNLAGDGSELAVLYADVDGTIVNPENPIELIFFTPEEASDVDLIHSRRKRQTNFGKRVTSRGVSRARQPVAPADNEKSESAPSPRTARQPQRDSPPRPRSRNTSPIRIPNRDLLNKSPAVDPTPKAADSKPAQFTLTNTRSRSRAAPPARKPKPAAPPARNSAPRRSLNRPRLPSSRNTVPLGNIMGRGFRRPALDTNVRTTSRFSRPSKNTARQPAAPTRNRNNRPNKKNNNNRRQESNKNPIQEFRNRPTAEIEPEPFLLPSSDGTFDIFEPITVTREVPVTTSIPFVENGRTIQKEVITASTNTEVIQPDQIVQTEINGEIKLLLSTIQNGNALTRVLIEPMETQIQVTANAFTNGKRTQITQVVPSQVFNVVTMTAAPGGDVQNLLQLLLGQQQQQQNPLLAALGLGQPTSSLQIRTSTYVTTVTSVLSTLLPIIFRGKMVTTTVVDSRTEVITATELITETVFAQNTLNPFIQQNPLNQLLPLLLQNQFQQQQPQNRPTRDEPVINDQPRTVAPTPPKVDPAPVIQTSVVTMFVSGRRPGEFSTVLSTVTLDGGASRFKRQPTQIVKPTALPQYIHTDKGLYKLPQDYEYDDMDWYIMSAINEVDSPNFHEFTPSLESVVPGLSYHLGQIPVTFNETIIADQDPFLWSGPAEHQTAKIRKIRSAQRGSRRFQGRFVGARKISSDTGKQRIVLDDDSVTHINTHPSVGEFKIPGLKIQNERISEQIKQINAPTTFYTTFTYYTTLVDESGREFVQSSLDTITQVATQGVSGVNELTRLVTTALPQDAGATEVFTLNDAIIPGKPRPVPEPSFEEPNPPFGPVIRNRGSRRPFQPVPEPPAPLSVQPVSERTFGGRPLFVLKRPIESPGESSQFTPAKPERRKVIKTLKRVIQKDEQTNSAAIESLPESEQSTTPTNRQRQRFVPSQLRQRESEDIPAEPSIVTKKQPQVKAPTAVAVPVDPYIGTIHTLYTVYSYLYEIDSGDGSLVSSTRDVTVSNRVRPTVVTVPEVYRTAGQELNTIEVGDVTATLGQRIRETLTTQIYLASATLVDLNSGFERSPGVGERKTERTSLRRPSLSLQSSLLENEEIQSTSETPAISTTARFRPTNRFGPPRQATELAETLEVQPEQEDEATAEITTEQEEPTSGRGGGRSSSRGSVRFRNSQNRPRFTVTRRRPQPAQIRTATPNRSRGGQATATARTPTPLRSFMRGRQRGRGSTVDRDVTTTPKPLPKLSRNRFRDRGESTATEESVFDDEELLATEVPLPEITISEKTTSESTTPERSSTQSLAARTTPTPTTRPPRPAVRRDDIPIIRRPGSDRSRRPTAGSLELDTSLAGDDAQPDTTERTRRPFATTESSSLSKTSSAFDFSSFFSQIPSDEEVVEESTSSPDHVFRFNQEPKSQPASTSPRTTTTTTSAPVKEFRFGKRPRSGEETGPVIRDPLLFKTGSEGGTPSRESRFRFSDRRETTTESSLLFGFTPEEATTESSPNSAFRFKFTPSPETTTTPKTDLDLSNLESDLLPAEYLDDYYDYYYDEDYVELDGTTQSTLADQDEFGKTGLGFEAPSKVLPPNVVYRTFTTNTFLPILGGEKTLTLSIVTSTLETLDATDAHLITKAPALFNPELLPKPLRSSVTSTTASSSKVTLPFGFFPSTTAEVAKTTQTAAFGEFRFGSPREDKAPESRRSRFESSRRATSPRPSIRSSPTSSLTFGFPTQEPIETERRSKFDVSQRFQSLDPSSVQPELFSTSTSSLAFSFPTFTTNFQQEETIEGVDSPPEAVGNPFEAGLFAINQAKESVEVQPLHQFEAGQDSPIEAVGNPFEAGLFAINQAKESVEVQPLNPFEAGLQAIQTSSQTDRPAEKGSTRFETRFREEEEEEVTVNPFEAAISALKSAIYESEVTETDQEAALNKEEDANLSIQDLSISNVENGQNSPFEGFSSFNQQENSIFFSNNQVEVSSEKSPSLHDESLLNAFEGFFESITEATTESTTSVPEEFSVSAIVIEKEVPITEISTVTEEYAVVNTEDSLVINLPEINETDNMISEQEDYNIMESVTNSVMKDSINAILESVDKEDAIFETVDPILESVDPYDAIFESVDPYDTILESVDPNDSILESVDPTDQILESVDPNDQILESVDPNDQILESVELPKTMEVESSTLMPGEETTTEYPEIFSAEVDLVGERDPKNIDLGENDQLGTNLELTGPNQNLATKVMSNGVKVIVAGDQTQGASAPVNSDLPSEQTIRNSLQNLGAAVTLPPSTLSGQVLLRPSAEQGDIEVTQAPRGEDGSLQTNTYFTTLTYFSTIMAANRPFVITSRETLSNFVTTSLPHTGNYVERTQVLVNTETYYTTQTFTRTLEGESTPITSQEVITQVIITEAPSVTRTSVMEPSSISPMVVTKTYLTTFTYYKTEVSDLVTQVKTDTVVSSEVVTETVFITPEPTSPVAEMTKTPAPSLDSLSDELVYATRTFYTTSTHLTTLLEGGSTVTTSSVDVQSRIVTETIAASNLVGLKGSEILMPTAVVEDLPQTEGYVPIGEDLYKQMKTFYATYTHYTTQADGSINSREVTKTKIETSTVSTTHVPQTLIIQPSEVIAADDYTTDYDYLYEDGADYTLIKPTAVSNTLLSSSSSGLRKPSLSASPSLTSSHVSGSANKPGRSSTKRGNQGSSSSSLRGRPSQISPSSTSRFNPSQLSSLKASIVTSQKTPGASVVQLDPSELFSSASDTTTEGLQATVMVEGGDTTDTKVVSDSTSSATILVGSSAQQDDFSSHTLVSTSVLSVPTVLRGIDGASSVLDIGGTIAVVERNGERTVLAGVPEGLRPSRPTLADIEVTSGTAHSSGATGQEAAPESSGVGTGAAIGLMVPVLSAVAGIIRNNMGGAAAVAAVAKSDRHDEKIDMPRNTLIRMEEPHFIPVGGVAASMSNARREFINPTQGFIPLNRFEGRATAEPSLVPLPRPISEFGGSSRGGGFQPFNNQGLFRAPSTTERGFTAIFTTGVVPTHVSVISGVETILFGEGLPKALPPPGLPAPPGGDFKLVQPSFEELPESRPVPEPALMEPAEFATAELPSGINSRIDDSPTFRLPTALSSRTIVSVNGENRIVKTQVVEAVPFDKSSQMTTTPEILLHSTVGVGLLPANDHVDQDNHDVVDNKRTTVVNGVSTVMSGATTIFGSLFTRPAGAESGETNGQVTSVISGDDGEITKFISKVDKAAMTLTSTVTEVKTMDGITSTVTEIVERTLPARIIVSTVVGAETLVNTETTLVPVPMLVVPITTEMEEEAISTTEFSFPEIDDAPSFAEHADAELNQPPNHPSLGLAEENEISRVIQSQSPNQQVILRDPIAVPDCKPRCSTVKNEVCKHMSSGKSICECRPGYTRNNDMNPCTPSRAFKVRVLLDSIKEDQLIFDPILHNMSHPATQDLSEVAVYGLNRAFMDSALAGAFNRVSVTKFDGIQYTALPISAKDVDGGVIAELKVELNQPSVVHSAGASATRQTLPDENFIKDALAQALRQSNFSLGGTEIFASPYAAVLESEDFDECAHQDHNDCSENALCFNARGTFSCSCRDGFVDEGELPGRECRERTAKCKFCNYHGECTTNQDGQRGCHCQPWFSGDTCQINLRVLLVVVVSVGGVLVLLMLLCGFFCCLKARRSRRAATQLLPSSTMGGASTLDRRAIVHDSSSEDSLHDAAPSYLTGHIRGPNKVRSDLEPAPQMLIPRVKGPAPKQPPQIQLGHDANSDLSTPQAALVDILEGRSRTSMRATPNLPRSSSVSGRAGSRSQASSRAGSRERLDGHRDPGFGGSRDQLDGHRNPGFGGSRDQLDGTVSAIGGRVGGSRDRYDESATGGHRSQERFGQAQVTGGGPRIPPAPPHLHDQHSKRFHQLEDEISVHGRDTARSKSSTYRFGGPERTISALRSCEETTVRPSLRSVPQHRPVSSQLLSEGGQTMAERDGCSTLVYPHQELYRPSQDLDSFSDMSEQQSRASHLFR